MSDMGWLRHKEGKGIGDIERGDSKELQVIPDGSGKAALWIGVAHDSHPDNRTSGIWISCMNYFNTEAEAVEWTNGFGGCDISVVKIVLPCATPHEY